MSHFVIGYDPEHTAEVDVYIKQRHKQRETVRQQNGVGVLIHMASGNGCLGHGRTSRGQ